MSLCIQKGIYITWFENQIILLDIIGDKYAVLSEAQSMSLREKLEQLQELKIPSLSNSLPGVSSNCWRLERKYIASPVSLRLIVLSLQILRSVHRTSRNQRLSGLVELLKDARIRDKKAHIESDAHLLICSLNRACAIYPERTKCLEWACALIILRAKFGLKSNLVLGVQNRPFYAHAWVEADGEVIGDDPDLRNKLSVIFEINQCF